MTPYFLNSFSTPPASFSETVRLRAMIFFQSKLTERYCVVFQTLNTKPELKATLRRA